MRISFTVPGPPVAKGRPRIGTIGGKARAFTPAKTVAFEGLVAHEGQAVMAGRAPLEGPLRLTVVAVFAIPASWSKKRKAEAHYHTGRPDADNLGKAIGDGLNAVCWIDDSQIAEMVIRKRYGSPARTCVIVETIGTPPVDQSDKLL